MKSLIQKETVRYLLSGSVFTALGPLVLWILLPLGATTAYIAGEVTLHYLRSRVHKTYIFRNRTCYTVTTGRYLIATAPVSVAGLVLISSIKTFASREMIVVCVGAFNMVAGYLWSGFIYSQRRFSRETGSNKASTKRC